MKYIIGYPCFIRSEERKTKALKGESETEERK